MENIKKKIIKIFIGSSIDELKEERDSLDLFLTKLGKRLCEKYVDRGLYINIEPVRCEDVDPAIQGDRKQNEYNELLRNCDICVFLFFTKAGEYTIEEFDNALDAFRSSGNVTPKIYTFFKRYDEKDAERTLTDFIERLDKDLQHYYTVFDSIDTVKLQLLLHLSILNSDFIAVEFEDGKCYVNGKEEKDVLNASQFANNNVLKELNSELEQTEKEYYSLKGKYPFEDEELNKKYRKLAERRQYLKDTIEQLKKDIFNMTLNICRDEASGKEITVRMREAYRLFEQGDLDGANRIINYAEIKDEYQRRKKMRADEQKKEDVLYIRELRAKINFLEADVRNPDRFAEIEEIYLDAVAVAKENLVETDVILEFASYLDDQGHSAQAYDLAKKFEQKYTSGKIEVDLPLKGRLFCLLGIICEHLSSKADEAEEYYSKAMNIYEKLVSESTEKYSDDLADIYTNLGAFYKTQSKPDKAEKYLLKSIEIYEKLVSKNLEMAIDVVGLPISYAHIGNFYNEQGDSKKAEGYLLKAIRIFEVLNKENPGRYNDNLANSYRCIGRAYDDQEEIEKAEENYLKSIMISEKLTGENPERYGVDLAMSYLYAGVFYNIQNKPDKAEDYCLKAIKIYEKLADESPERHSAGLAGSYNNIGNFYNNQGKPDKAEDYCLKAIEVFEKLAGENPERYSADLIKSYCNMGMACCSVANKKEYFDKAYAQASQYAPLSKVIIDICKGLSLS